MIAFPTGCGFLPRGTSRTGTEPLERAPKAMPVNVPLGGCGPEGSQPDYALNRLKNRVDDGSWMDTPWTVIARLPWPHAVGFRFRNQWTESERGQVSRYEGAPVRLEGYLQGYKLEGREPTNCYSSDPAQRDFHLWFAEHANESRTHSIVVEITPRIRARHPGWTEERLAALAALQSRIRVSGWLMLDQMHPERVGINRVTLWEVHPIMQIDVQQGGGWVPLDSMVVEGPPTPVPAATSNEPAPIPPRRR
jgi:hypothetical protein